MNSYDVQVHRETDSQVRRAKIWAKPFIEIIALKTAECGQGHPVPDGSGCSVRPHS